MADAGRAEDWKLCGVCGYPLEHDPMRRLGGPEWTHVRPVDPHVPVPVPASELRYYNGRCDFCDVSDVAWIFLADDFEIPNAGGQGSRGPWGACDECAALVEPRQWNKLATRVRLNPPPPERRVPSKFRTHERFMNLYRELDKHIHERLSLEEWRQRGNYPLKSD